MIDPVRPTYTFVLRLWHEPGAPQGDAGWRGRIRLLEADRAPVQETCFSDLVNLDRAIRTLLDDAGQPPPPAPLP